MNFQWRTSLSPGHLFRVRSHTTTAKCFLGLFDMAAHTPFPWPKPQMLQPLRTPLSLGQSEKCRSRTCRSTVWCMSTLAPESMSVCVAICTWTWKVAAARNATVEPDWASNNPAPVNDRVVPADAVTKVGGLSTGGGGGRYSPLASPPPP